MVSVVHVFRKGDIRNDLLIGAVYGKSRNGRPKTRYSDSIRDFGGNRSFVDLHRQARNREAWTATAVQLNELPSNDDDDDVFSLYVIEIYYQNILSNIHSVFVLNYEIYLISAQLIFPLFSSRLSSVNECYELSKLPNCPIIYQAERF